jgi:hypothetical protein
MAERRPGFGFGGELPGQVVRTAARTHRLKIVTYFENEPENASEYLDISLSNVLIY